MCARKNRMILGQKKNGAPRKGKMVTITIDDSSLTIPFVSFVCGKCKHFMPLKSGISIKRCKAFDEIPMEIWCERNDHTNPYPGDKGMRFKNL